MAWKNGHGDGVATAPAEVLKAFKRTSTPYLEAQEEWDRRTGFYENKITKQYRIIVGMTLAVIILAIYAMLAPGKVVYLPYVVEVSSKGDVRTVGILPYDWHGEIMAPIDAQVRDWLHEVREIPDSEIVWGKQWRRANARMTTSAQQKITEYGTKRDAMQHRGETVEIEITSVLPMTQDNKVVSVEWHERAIVQGGAIRAEADWKAVLTIKYVAPKTIKAEGEMRNPLGIFIADWKWAEKGPKK